MSPPLAAASMAKGPFSTPLVVDGRVFTLGTSAVLSAFDAATGALKWRKDWSKEIDTSRLFTGTAMSPIVDSGLLIVHDEAMRCGRSTRRPATRDGASPGTIPVTRRRSSLLSTVCGSSSR
jgi:outer membrane protein assembly factor BamB